MEYAEFLQAKRPRVTESGIRVDDLAGHLFPYQAECVRFLLRLGSGGLFLDTGLGKTLCELEWADHARRATSRRTIWRCPVVEMTRTKHVGLLYKQLQSDSAKSRGGMPDYLMTFVKPGDNAEPIKHTPEDFSLDQWQEWASPVWMTVNQTNVLNVKGARSENDEKHLCPLQLDVIDRALVMWSNSNDIVLSPFMGIGSEGYGALKLGRRFVGVELKEQYWRLACQNLLAATAQQGLFAA